MVEANGRGQKAEEEPMASEAIFKPELPSAHRNLFPPRAHDEDDSRHGSHSHNAGRPGSRPAHRHLTAQSPTGKVHYSVKCNHATIGRSNECMHVVERLERDNSGDVRRAQEVDGRVHLAEESHSLHDVRSYAGETRHRNQSYLKGAL